jgi:hypothetical protein
MSRSDPYDDEDEDRPRRRRPRDHDDDEDRPRVRRRRGDELEDDYRDGPRPRRASEDGMGKAAMIVGIVSLAITLLTGLLSCLCFLGIFGVGLGAIGGIVAVILGFVARSRTPGSGPGLTGILTGFGSLLLALVMGLLVALGVGIMAMNQPPGGGNNNFGGPGGGGIQRNRF